jgi:hypothetical protein
MVFFTQVSALFPHAAQFSIDYRAEGYVCEAGEWRELDTRPYFPIDENDKENRFQRVLFFYRKQKAVLNAVDQFLVDRHNGGGRDDGIPPDRRIGGVRLLSIRSPLPEIGAPLVRVHRVPLAEIPEKERKIWFSTPGGAISQRCFGKRPRGVRPRGEPFGIDPSNDEHLVDPGPSDEPRDRTKDDSP